MAKKYKLKKLFEKFGKGIKNKLVKKKKKKVKGKKKVKKSSKKIRSKIQRKSIKKTKRRAIKKKSKSSKKSIISYGKPIGEIVHFFNNLGVGVVKLKNTLKLNDEILIKGATTDFKQKVKSMQIDREPVVQAKKGQEVGLLVSSRVRRGDSVYIA